MIRNLIATCALFVTGTICARAAEPRNFQSFYSVEDVVLATDPFSAFWQGALPLYAELDPRGNPVAHHRTEVRSRWTHKNLYLLFVCPYELLNLKPNPSVTTETYELWNWDVAELFIGSDFRNIRRYKEFEVSPQGEWIDLDVNLDLPDHTVGWTWNSGFEVTARIDRKAKIWYAAMRISFSAIDQRPPAVGNTFRANLYRSQGPPDQLKSIAWKPPMSDTFHTPERFGLLELVGTYK